MTAHNGAVFVLAKHRDAKPDGKDAVCEAAVYRLGPAMFAR